MIVKVTTDNGIVGWGESIPAAHRRHRQLVNTTLATVTRHGRSRRGRRVGPHLPDAARQPRHGRRPRHGDERPRQALWDIRGKAAGWPLYRLLGGTPQAVPAYAGGISLGFQPPDELVEEAQALVEAGYKA